MADRKKRRAVAAVDFKSLELANILQFENKVKEKEKLGVNPKQKIGTEQEKLI